MTHSPEVSGERLLADLRTLAGIGGRPDGGVDRLAGSPADLDGRLWLRRTMREAGLEARADEVNNVFGTVPGGSAPWLWSDRTRTLFPRVAVWTVRTESSQGSRSCEHFTTRTIPRLREWKW